jgi:hypothetical protein
MEKKAFEQDGARPHILNAVLRFLSENFHDRIISHRYSEPSGSGWSWPVYLPDLNHCGYFLWVSCRTVSTGIIHIILKN